MGLTPDFRIEIQGQVLPINHLVTEIRVTDEIGFISDSLELTISNEPQNLIPRTGAAIQLSMGYKETGLWFFSEFIIDEVIIEAPPKLIKIRAHGADFKQSLKVRKSRAWHIGTIKSLVETIASNHNLTASISKELANIALPHLDQTNESDMHFLTRLAEKYSSIAKPTNNHLLFIAKSALESVSGKLLPITKLAVEDLTSWRITISDRASYGSVVASWYDQNTAQTIEEKVGEEPPEYVITTHYSSKDEAISAATAKLLELSRNKQILNLTLPGNPELTAESGIKIYLYPGLATNWIITRLEHSIDASGFITSLEARPAL